MVRVPCEFLASSIIPVVRRELALKLVKSGFSQRKVAKMLRLTPSAVSQYMHSKRGVPKINGFEYVQKEIERLFNDFVNNKKEQLSGKDFCEICIALRKNKDFIEKNRDVMEKTLYCLFEEFV